MRSKKPERASTSLRRKQKRGTRKKIEEIHAKFNKERQMDASGDARLGQVERELAAANERLRSIQNEHEAEILKLRAEWKRQYDDSEMAWKSKHRGVESELELHKASTQDASEQQYDDLRKQYEELKVTCESKHQAISAELERKVFEVEKEWSEKHSALQLEHQEKVGAIKSEHEQKHSALQEELKRKHMSMSEECEKVRAEDRRQFEAELARCEFSSKTHEREKKELLVELGEKTALGEHAGGQAEALERRAANLETEVQRARAELDNTRRKLDESLDAARKDQDSFLGEIKVLRTEVESANKEKGTVKALLEECSAKYSSLQAQRAVELGSKLSTLRNGRCQRQSGRQVLL